MFANQLATYMKNSFLSIFIFSLVSFGTKAQVTKLPAYAIQTISQMDGPIRDTIGPMYGGKLRYEDRPYEYKDSILFEYNPEGQLIRENIWRFPINKAYRILDSTGRTALDTYRNFREHEYDSKGRKILVRHGKIYGSPYSYNVNNWPNSYPYSGPVYFEIIHKTDTIAYDSHDNKLYQRRYEMFDFSRGNFKLVLKPTNSLDETDIEYVYDEQGRIIEESHYYYQGSARVLKQGNGALVLLQYKYNYIGNSTRPSSKSYPYSGWSYIREFSVPPFFTRKDSLLHYDAKGRYTGTGGVFGEPAKDQYGQTYIDYQQNLTKNIYSVKGDSMVYLDDYGSFQRKFYDFYEGKRYHSDGRLYFKFTGDLDTNHRLCPFSNCVSGIKIHNANRYNKDPEGNILSRDSSYIHLVYHDGVIGESGMPRPNDGHNRVFDTIVYYDFRTKEDHATALLKNKSNSVAHTRVEMYPNPASDLLWVRSNFGGVLRLYDHFGRLVLERALLVDTDNAVPLSGLGSGIYLAVYNDVSQKLIIK
jgi:hypothetical protein